jgi:hypothetical protein
MDFPFPFFSAIGPADAGRQSTMTRSGMAMDTAYRIRISYIAPEHFVYHIFMAFHAVVLKDSAVLFFDHYGFMKILHREGSGVVVAILGFGPVFTDQIVR